MSSRLAFGQWRRVAACSVAVSATACAATSTFSPPLGASRDDIASVAGQIVTDRPDHSDSPVLVPTGRVQLETGEAIGREGDVPYLKIGEVMLRVGVHRAVELRIAANSFAMHRAGPRLTTGVEDAAIGLKLALHGRQIGPLPVLAAIVSTTLPSGAHAVSTRRWLPEAKLAAAWDLPRGVDLVSTISVARIPGAGATTQPRVGASTTLGYAVTTRLWSYLEGFGLRDGARSPVSRTFTDAGVAYLVTDDIQVDARIGVGLGVTRRDYFTGFGLSRRW